MKLGDPVPDWKVTPGVRPAGWSTELHKYTFCFTCVFLSIFTLFFGGGGACGELLKLRATGERAIHRGSPVLFILSLPLVGFGCFPS